MGVHALANITSSEIAGTLEPVATSQKTWRTETGAVIRELAPLRSAVRLLALAGRALSGGEDNARKYIVRAAALLQAEEDLRNQDAATVTGTARCRLAPWQVTRVMRFIELNLSEKIGPKDFAGLTRLSASHFGRAFRATVGESPYAYLVRRRIERAKEMMLETDSPLVQIALDCGLADQAHMTRLFTRIVGISPGAWRRTHVASVDEPHSSESDASTLEHQGEFDEESLSR